MSAILDSRLSMGQVAAGEMNDLRDYIYISKILEIRRIIGLIILENLHHFGQRLLISTARFVIILKP
ncbi:MAG: hypothetical protein HOC91_09045 [Nitrospinaceae bacterium]|jgi:hypothetical protein|nr:hypothetical protein [Nitrospinaceae bacterium]MBT3432716.1 hypothetical protein [Nitrospinaceae bacterium]MBT3820008.1 hypothetical protein [Nitrospinaceae bacterium]MBT4430645.1 hypothetical protein [Nitrospinaceae bacterium]MBT6395477.1 hypothetical protein [Nitrospinaceae bacterium]